MPGAYRQGRLSSQHSRSAVAGLLSSEPATSWQDLAACRGSDPELFIEGERERDEARQDRRDRAFAYCTRCPVVTECFDDAIDHKDLGVIRGGRVFSHSWRGEPGWPRSAEEITAARLAGSRKAADTRARERALRDAQS